MKNKAINPWKWQDQFGFSQAIETHRHERVLHITGQAPISADGQLVHAWDMPAQLNATLDNLEAVLAEAGYELADLVRLNWYTTDVDLIVQHWSVILSRLGDVRPAETLLGVSRLLFPGQLLEIEATASKS
ncbi:RidA family protein [Hymenobacter terrenus]|uniref:RidA family protein n=1 Tax=Hymenobacter terrenus TaxID=1629124 RepID=UPI000619A083|nr:RidA family protein [Hymenobacter terrenus]